MSELAVGVLGLLLVGWGWMGRKPKPFSAVIFMGFGIALMAVAGLAMTDGAG